MVLVLSADVLSPHALSTGGKWDRKWKSPEQIRSSWYMMCKTFFLWEFMKKSFWNVKFSNLELSALVIREQGLRALVINAPGLRPSGLIPPGLIPWGVEHATHLGSATRCVLFVNALQLPSWGHFRKHKWNYCTDVHWFLWCNNCSVLCYFHKFKCLQYLSLYIHIYCTVIINRPSVDSSNSVIIIKIIIRSQVLSIIKDWMKKIKTTVCFLLNGELARLLRLLTTSHWNYFFLFFLLVFSLSLLADV